MANDTQSSLVNNRAKIFLMIALGLAILGSLVSLYSIDHHLEVKLKGSSDFACNINQTFNCDDIARSKYSEFFSIPLGVWGLGYFLSNALLVILIFTNRKSEGEYFKAYTPMVIIGILVSITLAIISQVFIGKFCTTCMGVYLLSGLQLANLMVFKEFAYWKIEKSTLLNGSTVPLTMVAFTIIGYNFLKPQKLPSHQDLPQQTEQQSSAGDFLDKAENIPIDKSPYSGLGEDYRKGNDSAKVVIVEFADFQCPACKNASQMVNQLYQEYGNQILAVFKNYPLDKSCNPALRNQIHNHACQAAILGRCAGMYGKFWQFHDKAFDQQTAMSPDTLTQWAKDIGLTDSQIKECLDSKDIIAKIKDDIALGNQIGVDATPTVFINGRKYLGGREFFTVKNQISKLLTEP